MHALTKILFPCQKICQQGTIPSANDFSHPAKCSQRSPNLVQRSERCRQENLKAFNSLSNNGLLSSLTTILHHVVQNDSLTEN